MNSTSRTPGWQMPSTYNYEDLPRQIAQLPVLPTTLMQVLALDRSDPRYFDDVVHLVEREPTYAARVIARRASDG